MLFRPLSFAFRRGSFLLCSLPFRGAQSYEVFRFVKTPSLLHPSLDRESKGTEFLTFTSIASPCHRVAISQRSCQTAQLTLPRYHPPFCFIRSPLSGSAKLRNFLLCQAPSRPYPPRDGKVTDFLALTSPYFQRPLSPSRERKGTKLFTSSSPSPYPPPTS